MERAQNQKEKSLAWFKLADLIARGEREKALSVFRLLAHSLSDRAYVLQIEGDILWYLDDQSSIEKYKQAAFLYQKEKRFVDAISIYEHLLTVRPKAAEIVIELIAFYALIDWVDKFRERFDYLVHLLNDGHVDDAKIEKLVKELIQQAQFDESSTKQWLLPQLEATITEIDQPLAGRLKVLLNN